MAEGVSAGLTAVAGRRFALTVGAAFLALAGFLAWRGHLAAAAGSGALAIALIAAGLFVPARLGRVYRAWMSFAVVLSKVTTPLIMGVLYFVVLTPSGFVLRALGRNPIRRAEGSPSFWVSRQSGRSDLTRQF